MNIITVTKSQSLSGQYKIVIKRDGQSTPQYHHVGGIGNAAGKVMELAISCGDAYQIHGDSSVLELIKKGGISGDSS